MCPKMDIEFEDGDLARLETDVGFDAGYGQNLVRAFRKRMYTIRGATDERTFYASKGLHYEKLKGDRQHERSMKLNDQFRLILRIKQIGKGKVIVVVKIEDYH